MGFLAPWFLGGIVAVGLPLWIHLLRQYRSTPFPFSSLMFFERRTQSSIKHRKLRYLALLTMRILLLALIALAFANPFVTRTIAASSGRHSLIFAIDDSFSMRYADHLAQAKRQALDALAKLHAGDKAQVVAADSQLRFLTQMTSDHGQLRSAIESLQPSDSRSSFGELARGLRTLSQALKTPLEVHLFSDLQQSALPPAFADLRLGPNTELVFHSVASGKSPNWMVESVSAPGRIYDPKKVRIDAVIASTNANAASRTVSLVLDGKVLDSKTVQVPQNGRVTVEFLKLESPYGFHRAEIRIDPGDSLREDDRFPFAVERADPHRVLFLHQAGQNRAELYYRTALESSPDAGFVLEPLDLDQAANQAFSKYAFVVLSDAGSMPSGLEDGLRRYVSSGGSLLVALGPSSVALHRIPVAALPILESRYSSREGDRFQSVASADPEHPAIRRTNKLDGVEFFQSVKTDPGKARVVARLTDGTPLLIEQQHGEGRILVFASTLDNISNDFPLHSSFLPFVQETAHYLGGQQDRSTIATVDSSIDLRAAKDQGAAIDVIAPDGTRPLSLKEASSAQVFQVAREGFYEIRRANGRQELVAVHADRRESDLSAIPAETLDLWRRSGGGANEPGPAGSVSVEAKPWSLWRYALILVLLLSILESVFAGRYLSIEKDAA